jgi:uncharacterized delta-60 repeat protein
MKKNQLLQKLPFLVSLFLVSSFCFAQVTEEWVSRYNGPGNSVDIGNAVAVDASGNVYVTGLSRNAPGGFDDADYGTIKYNNAGGVIWVARYNGPAGRFDKGTAIAVDAAGNVYVTGWSTGTSGTGDNTDYATIKYNTDGVQQWVARYEGIAKLDDRAESIAVDVSGNVYITGYSGWSPTSGDAIDYATIKYNSAGVQQWVKRYNGPAGGRDIASSLKVDGAGNVYVTGGSGGIGTAGDFATIKYNTMGILQWVARYNGPANGRDFAASLAIDAAGNVYVTGESTGVKSNYDYATVKYNARGTQLWVARYNGPVNEQDLAHSLAVDASGNVYVTGYSDAMSGASFFNNDYATIKYNKLGIRQWVRRYDGPSGAQDVANALVLDAAGNVYVTGLSQNDPHGIDYTTIRYDATGTLQWLTIYNGPGNTGDYARAMTIDAVGNVYVTGESYGGATSIDYATIKYSQPPAIAKRPAPAKLSKDMPSRFQVSNYPNPVASTTRIQYELPYDGQVNIKMYDVLGREVATLVNANMKAGYYSTDFNAASHQNGVYYYKIIVKTEKKIFNQSRKILVLK